MQSKSFGERLDEALHLLPSRLHLPHLTKSTDAISRRLKENDISGQFGLTSCTHQLEVYFEVASDL